MMMKTKYYMLKSNEKDLLVCALCSATNCSCSTEESVSHHDPISAHNDSVLDKDDSAGATATTNDSIHSNVQCKYHIALLQMTPCGHVCCETHFWEVCNYVLYVCMYVVK